MPGNRWVNKVYIPWISPLLISSVVVHPHNFSSISFFLHTTAIDVSVSRLAFRTRCKNPSWLDGPRKVVFIVTWHCSVGIPYRRLVQIPMLKKYSLDSTSAQKAQK
jgi:hypothetical protein